MVFFNKIGNYFKSHYRENINEVNLVDKEQKKFSHIDSIYKLVTVVKSPFIYSKYKEQITEVIYFYRILVYKFGLYVYSIYFMLSIYYITMSLQLQGYLKVVSDSKKFKYKEVESYYFILLILMDSNYTVYSGYLQIMVLLFWYIVVILLSLNVNLLLKHVLKRFYLFINSVWQYINNTIVYKRLSSLQLSPRLLIMYEIMYENYVKFNEQYIKIDPYEIYDFFYIKVLQVCYFLCLIVNLVFTIISLSIIGLTAIPIFTVVYNLQYIIISTGLEVYLFYLLFSLAIVVKLNAYKKSILFLLRSTLGDIREAIAYSLVYTRGNKDELSGSTVLVNAIWLFIVYPLTLAVKLLSLIGFFIIMCG